MNGLQLEKKGKCTHSSIVSVLDKKELLHLFEEMLLIRKFELAVQDNYKKGLVPGFIHLYIGEEAVATGVCGQLKPQDWITSTHRGHGHALAKGVDPKSLMAELFGKSDGCCGGRGGTMHIYSPVDGFFGTNGIVGGGIPLAVGLGLSEKVKKTENIAVSFFGDGAINHGSFHESINFAGTQNAPVIFVCENNLYATCIPINRATKNSELASKAAAYGVAGISVDGNDVLAVTEAMQDAVKRARSGNGPTLIEARTYRTVGHHEGDVLTGTYRTLEELESWKQRCPILKFKKYLLDSKITADCELDLIAGKIDKIVAEAVEFAKSSALPDLASVKNFMFAKPVNPREALNSEKNPKEYVTQSWLDAVRDAFAEEMRRNPHIIYMGEGIGERGGSWGHTKHLWQEFGEERVIDTPISELGFTGAAIGASASGARAVADLMVADFLFDAGSQIAQQAGKLRYMSNNKISVPVIIRAGAGSIKQTGPHHSGTYYPIWAHCPGLIVAVPSNPADAKGLMKTALRAHDPVIFLEPKTLFSTKGPVPVGEHYVPFGQANIVRQGCDITVVSCGLPLIQCLDAAKSLAPNNISCEVIDLRTIVPLDVDTIVQSVTKTGRVLIVDESYAMCGIGAEIAAVIMEHAFDELDAPVGRLHTEPVAHPFSPALTSGFLITPEKIAAAIKDVIRGKPPIHHRNISGLSGNTEAAVKQAAEDVLPASQENKTSIDGDLDTNRGVEVIMPNQDLTVSEARVVRWLVQKGDSVLQGDPLVEVETDKAVQEIESPVNGTVDKILIDDDTIIPLGQRLCIIKPTDGNGIQ